jgi:hypothetical protein
MGNPQPSPEAEYRLRNQYFPKNDSGFFIWERFMDAVQRLNGGGEFLLFLLLLLLLECFIYFGCGRDWSGPLVIECI